jgi:hypothetical protein
LALLPGGRGACSWEDGCGVRANQEGKNVMTTNENKTSKLKDFWNNFKEFFTTETSHEDKRQALQTMVDALDNSNWFHYVKAVYDDFFVYSAQPANPSTGNSAKLWKQPYTIKENGEVELGDDITEVKEVVDYEPINNNAATNNKKGVSDMAKDNKCCPEKIQLLIENEATKFTEDDRVWLEGLSESAVDKLMPEERSEIQKVVDATAQDIADGKLVQQAMVLNKDGLALVEEKPPGDGGDPKPETTDEFIANAPVEMRDVLKSGLAMHREKKVNLVTGILANKANTFAKEDLDVMEVKQLENIAALAAVKSKDFSLNSSVHPQNADDEVEVMTAPTFDDYAPAPAK